jgi:hypothetical protein
MFVMFTAASVSFLVGAHFLDEYEESSKPLLENVSITGIECSCKSGFRDE